MVAPITEWNEAQVFCGSRQSPSDYSPENIRKAYLDLWLNGNLWTSCTFKLVRRKMVDNYIQTGGQTGDALREGLVKMLEND